MFKRPHSHPATSTRGKRRWYLLLLVLPFIALLWPPSYNFRTPVLLGIPFFYWYQLLWIILTAILTVIIYRVEEA